MQRSARQQLVKGLNDCWTTRSVSFPLIRSFSTYNCMWKLWVQGRFKDMFACIFLGMLEPWYNFTQLSRALLWPSSKASLFRSALYWPVITCIELYQPQFDKVYCNPAELHLYAEISPDNRGHWGFNSYSSLTHLFARHHGQNLPRETEQKRDQIIYWLLYTLFSNMDITAS